MQQAASGSVPLQQQAAAANLIAQDPNLLAQSGLLSVEAMQAFGLLQVAVPPTAAEPDQQEQEDLNQSKSDIPGIATCIIFY